MSTLKRLKDEDVKTIFDCLHGTTEGKRPPPHLQFKIVPVGPNGLKLSPPSYEFEDGLYVLLRPEKKKTSKRDPTTEKPKAPEHLEDLVMRDLPMEACPWSLSGPQFPGGISNSKHNNVETSHAGIQQRYCYPKGRPEYSSHKGGALWTMCSKDGKEDHEFRLLHVYVSPKRAANKGVPLSKEALDYLSSPTSTRHHPLPLPKNKRARYIAPRHYPDAHSDHPHHHPRGKVFPDLVRWQSHPPPPPSSSPLSALPTVHSPVSTSFASPSFCSSSLSFEIMAPFSSENENRAAYTTNTAAANHHHPPRNNNQSNIANFVSPISIHHPGRMGQTPAHTLTSAAMPPFRHPFRNPHGTHSIYQSPLQRSGHSDSGSGDDSSDDEDAIGTNITKNIKPLLLDPILFAETDASIYDVDSVWNDPFLEIFFKPSQDPLQQRATVAASSSQQQLGTVCSDSAASSASMPATTTAARFYSSSAKATASTPSVNNAGSGGSNNCNALVSFQHPAAESLASRLVMLHESCLDSILSAPAQEQAELVHVLASWARRVANDPLAGNDCTDGDDNNDEGDDETGATTAAV